MPFGMQVIGGFRQDLALLEICKSLEWAWARDPALARPLPTWIACARSRRWTFAPAS